MICAQLAQSAERDPSAESHKRRAGNVGYDVAQAVCESDARKPEPEAEHQCRSDVTETGDQSPPRRLGTRPALLTCDQRDRHPMIGNDRMQNPDAAGSHEEQ
jgi:hypothetical protein